MVGYSQGIKLVDLSRAKKILYKTWGPMDPRLPMKCAPESSLWLSHNGLGYRRGLSKRVEDGSRLPALFGGHPRNGCKAVSGVACPQVIEGYGRMGSRETLESPWLPLAMRPWTGLMLGGEMSEFHETTRMKRKATNGGPRYPMPILSKWVDMRREMGQRPRRG
jgi:hypothetical protein